MRTIKEIKSDSLRAHFILDLPYKTWREGNGDPDSECWIWGGVKFPDGVGAYYTRTHQLFLAHRICYEVFYGKIPKGMYVCHTCGNKSCVNPHHLFIGSLLDDRIKQMGRNSETSLSAQHAQIFIDRGVPKDIAYKVFRIGYRKPKLRAKAKPLRKQKRHPLY